MDRRSFFRTMIGGVAAAAAVRTWPFRVYSFPMNLATDVTSYLADAKIVYGAIQQQVEKLPVVMNLFDYAGIPIVVDPRVPPNKIFFRQFSPTGL